MKPALKFVLSLLPDFAAWVEAMVDRGDDEETIVRNIRDQTAEIKASRERTAEAFLDKFGEKL